MLMLSIDLLESVLGSFGLVLLFFSSLLLEFSPPRVGKTEHDQPHKARKMAGSRTRMMMMMMMTGIVHRILPPPNLE